MLFSCELQISFLSEFLSPKNTVCESQSCVLGTLCSVADPEIPSNISSVMFGFWFIHLKATWLVICLEKEVKFQTTESLSQIYCAMFLPRCLVIMKMNGILCLFVRVHFEHTHMTVHHHEFLVCFFVIMCKNIHILSSTTVSPGQQEFWEFVDPSAATLPPWCGGHEDLPHLVWVPGSAGLQELHPPHYPPGDGHPPARCQPQQSIGYHACMLTFFSHRSHKLKTAVNNTVSNIVFMSSATCESHHIPARLSSAVCWQL